MPHGPLIMSKVLIATSNAGKLRDFAGAAGPLGLAISGIPNFHLLPEVVEDGLTFEANARKKAAEYSLHALGEIVLADDSGLEVDALNGAPGVHSARYAALEDLRGEGLSRPSGKTDTANSPDTDNNGRLLRELASVAPERKTARFVCALAAARDGEVLAVFSEKAEGLILIAPRGTHGFGYDSLFVPAGSSKTLGEMSQIEKNAISHRAVALRILMDQIRQNGIVIAKP